MFGDTLKMLRLEKQLTQEELGKLLNKTKNNISQYETGKREPDIGTMKAIADYFDVTVDYLLGNSAFRKSPSSDETDLRNELLESIKTIQNDSESNEKSYKMAKTIIEALVNAGYIAKDKPLDDVTIKLIKAAFQEDAERLGNLKKRKND